MNMVVDERGPARGQPPGGRVCRDPRAVQGHRLWRTGRDRPVVASYALRPAPDRQFSAALRLPHFRPGSHHQPVHLLQLLQRQSRLASISVSFGGCHRSDASERAARQRRRIPKTFRDLSCAPRRSPNNAGCSFYPAADMELAADDFARPSVRGIAGGRLRPVAGATTAIMFARTGKGVL